MRRISIFGKPSYREIRPMRGRLMRGLPVFEFSITASPSILSIQLSSRMPSTLCFEMITIYFEIIVKLLVKQKYPPSLTYLSEEKLR